MFDRNVKLEIPCPECGYKVKMSIKELEQNPTYICPGCKKTVNVDAGEFKRDLKAAENKLKNLFK